MIAEVKPDREFYLQDAVTLAEELIGYHLIRRVDDMELIMRVVETEAYCGPEDKASHAHSSGRTERTEPMYRAGGHSYVYLIYGIHCCFNVVAAGPKRPHAVLIRAAEPVRGLVQMKKNRQISGPGRTDLGSGPGRLCQALKIDRRLSGLDLTETDEIFFSENDEKRGKVERARRINIDYAEEYRDKRWRFFDPDSSCLSR